MMEVFREHKNSTDTQITGLFSKEPYKRDHILQKSTFISQSQEVMEVFRGHKNSTDTQTQQTQKLDRHG